MKVVTTFASGASSSRRSRLPVWSRSSWVNQIQRRSLGRTIDVSASTKSSVSAPVPVSTSTGSAARITNAFIGMTPTFGTGQ